MQPGPLSSALSPQNTQNTLQGQGPQENQQLYGGTGNGVRTESQLTQSSIPLSSEIRLVDGPVISSSTNAEPALPAMGLAPFILALVVIFSLLTALIGVSVKASRKKQRL